MTKAGASGENGGREGAPGRGLVLRAAALVQGTCLGVLLFLALCGLIAAWGEAQLFRYQGF